MIVDGGRDGLTVLVRRQTDSLFGLDDDDVLLIDAHLEQACERALFCFDKVNNRHFRRKGETVFNPFHLGQYCVFLYFLTRTIFVQTGQSRSLDKLYMLNRTISGADLFYEVELPDVWFMDHTSGIVLGRAKYGERLMVSQGCTVGNNHGRYPVIGDDVSLLASAKVLGACRVGNRVAVAAGAIIVEEDIPDDFIVFGRSPELTIKPLPENKRPHYFIQAPKEGQ